MSAAFEGPLKLLDLPALVGLAGWGTVPLVDPPTRTG